MSRQTGLARALDDLRKLKADVKKLEDKAPNIVGVEAVMFIQENFDKQSYNGVPWKKRSPKTNAAYDRRSGVKGSVFSSSNPILKQTGNLKDAIRKTVSGTKVFVGFDENKVPYGRVHNEGGVVTQKQRSNTHYFSATGKFRSRKKGERATKGKKSTTYAHSYKMPKRQFMPGPTEQENPNLFKRIVKKLIFERDRIFRKFER